jgi:micrococcal nuclease
MNMKREPVAIVSAIIAVIETLIALLVAFGLKLTGEQVGAIMAFVTAVGSAFLRSPICYRYRRLLASATLCVLPAVGHAQDVDGEGPSGPVRTTIPCELTRIVDGDTIECQGTGRVRLIGMDTPERGQGPYGAMATRALSALLEQATTVRLERDVELRDRYGRMLAYVWADSVMVNWALVRQGFAVVLTYPPNVQYVDSFTTAQRLAREEGVGLWGIGGFECLPRDRRRGRCE